MENMIKTLAYAGLGLAKQTNDKMKTQFDEFVEVGKKSDIEGKNLVGDFFKTVDTTREEFESQISKNKNKIEEIQKEKTDLIKLILAFSLRAFSMSLTISVIIKLFPVATLYIPVCGL